MFYDMIYSSSKTMIEMESIPRYGQTYVVRLNNNRITSGTMVGISGWGFLVKTPDGEIHKLDFFKFLGPRTENNFAIPKNEEFSANKPVNC